MKDNKTQPNSASIDTYVATIEHEGRRQDAATLLITFKEATKAEPVLWGTSIVGFGTYHYIYDTGREGDTVAVGFSARKQALVLYGLFHFENNEQNIALAERLGTHTNGKGCLYIKRLSDIDLNVLCTMIKNAYSARNS